MPESYRTEITLMQVAMRITTPDGKSIDATARVGVTVEVNFGTSPTRTDLPARMTPKPHYMQVIQPRHQR